MRQGIEMKRKTNLVEATVTVMFHDRTPSLGFFRVRENVEQTLPQPLTATESDKEIFERYASSM